MAPAKKYCDMTGLEAPYTCPRTLMRYSDKATYQAIQDLPEGGEQGFLAMRNAAAKLK